MTEPENGVSGLIGRDGGLPETPHELPVDRGKVDELVDRVRQGERLDLLEAFLGVVDWRAAFGGEGGSALTTEELARLVAYYRSKFADVGPLYLAELLSTEFMTEQRARGDVVFSEKLLALGRQEPELWSEIRLFFRRKEFVTALLTMAHGDGETERGRDGGGNARDGGNGAPESQ